MEKNECEKLLKDYCSSNGIFCDENILSNFYRYYQILVRENEKYNLTNITEIQDVYVKHFIDCIELSKYIKDNASICDIGTGAGFPGLVLKIVRPDLEVVLVDSLNKRVNFLNMVINELKLEKVVALHFRAEDVEFKNKYLNSFDYVVSRAVAKLNTLLEYCLPYVKVGGEFLAMKGSDVSSELAEIVEAHKKLGGEKMEFVAYSLFDMKRAIVRVNKCKLTDKKYPRSQNKARISPLK